MASPWTRLNSSNSDATPATLSRASARSPWSCESITTWRWRRSTAPLAASSSARTSTSLRGASSRARKSSLSARRLASSSTLRSCDRMCDSCSVTRSSTRSSLVMPGDAGTLRGAGGRQGGVRRRQLERKPAGCGGDRGGGMVIHPTAGARERKARWGLTAAALGRGEWAPENAPTQRPVHGTRGHSARARSQCVWVGWGSTNCSWS
mmetsp:Transcript_26156/g.83542  ORF Transcript_26156/g.83542 Transcript_26156/m.83542 type:complete len:207 (-) Transcript_26156:37-657(-)